MKKESFNQKYPRFFRSYSWASPHLIKIDNETDFGKYYSNFSRSWSNSGRSRTVNLKFCLERNYEELSLEEVALIL